MSEVAVRQTPAQLVVAQVRSEEFKEQAAMVLPENVPASRFVRATITALMTNQDIAKCDGDSLFAALYKAAADGLLPDGREAAIVAYGKSATYLPMIGGVIKIAAEHGWSMSTRVVYSNDEFDYELGLNERIDHKPAAGERGDRVYAYAIARHRDGRAPMVDVMDAAEIEKVKKVSRGASRGPWVDWPERMWEKSVGHRLFKRLPLDPGDKRVARIALDAEDLGPDESARLLYGPAGARFRAIEAPKDSPQGAVDGGPEASASQQVAEREVAPGDEPGDNGTLSAAPGFTIPEAVIDAAGKVEVQPGWTVEAICADAAGPDYVVWALGPGYDDSLNPSVIDAIRLYVEHRLPAIWAAVNAS